MDRYDITHVSKMLDKGFDFLYINNGIMSFKRECEKNGWYRVYTERSICIKCRKPHYRKRGMKTRMHNDCKVFPTKETDHLDIKDLSIENKELANHYYFEREKLRGELTKLKEINPMYKDRALIGKITGYTQKINKLTKVK